MHGRKIVGLSDKGAPHSGGRHSLFRNLESGSKDSYWENGCENDKAGD